MSALVVLLGFLVALGLMVLKTLVVDEMKGQIQRRIRESVEATIMSLPAEIAAEWEEEWRAELATIIAMPLTAARFAAGLRQTAEDLVVESAIASDGATPQPRRRPTEIKHFWQGMCAAGAQWARRGARVLALAVAYVGAAAVAVFCLALLVAGPSMVTGPFGIGVGIALGVLLVVSVFVARGGPAAYAATLGGDVVAVVVVVDGWQGFLASVFGVVVGLVVVVGLLTLRASSRRSVAA